MSATANNFPITATAWQRLVAAYKAYRAAKAAARIEARRIHSVKKQYHAIYMVRGTVSEENFITGYEKTFPASACLLENGYGDRRVESSHDAIEGHPAIKAYLRGVPIEEVKRINLPPMPRR
jgi:hypothetical protein